MDAPNGWIVEVWYDSHRIAASAARPMSSTVSTLSTVSPSTRVSRNHAVLYWLR